MLSYYLKKTESRCLPHHDGPYIITTTGGVFDKSTMQNIDYDWDVCSLPTSWKNKHNSFLVALAFKPVFLTYEQVNLLTVEFLDGNSENLSPPNLVWRYPSGGMEASHWPGYYYIPSYRENSLAYPR